METVVMKRALIILGIFVTVIVASVACNALTRSAGDPEISNKDEVFMRFGDIEITNEMLYERMKVDDGLSQLINHVDQTLLADYIDAVTEEEIEKKILEQTYGSSDEDEIALLSEFEKTEKEQNFRDGIILAGFNPEDDDSVETFIRMILAQEEYTKAQYRTTDEESEFYITLDDLESFYNDYEQGTMMAIPLRFSNIDERNAVFNHFNIVRDFEGGFGRYHGDEPIEDVEQGGFDEDNTDLLDDDEVLMMYIEMYNYLNQHRDPIDLNASIEDLVALENPHFTFNQRELQTLAAERQDDNFHPYTDLSTYLFEDLREFEQSYSLSPTTILGERFYFFALDYEEVEAFEDLDFQDDILPMKDRYIETLIGDEQIDEALFELHEKNDLTIYDDALTFAYLLQTGIDLYEEGSGDNDIIATFGDETLYVDDFFDILSHRVGAATALNIAQTKGMIQSVYFEDLYGTRKDVWDNNSDLMRLHRYHLSEERSWFNNNRYHQWFISPEVITWQQYLSFFGGATQIRNASGNQHMPGYLFTQNDNFGSETAVLERMVEHVLRYEFIMDRGDFTDIEGLVNKQFDNYFDLSVEELLIYMDEAFDFFPDNYEEMMDALDEQERENLDTLHQDLFDLIKEMIEEEEMSLEDIVESYKEALRGEDENDEDYSMWARFKNAGLRIEANELGNMNYRTARNETEAFIENLQAAYHTMLDDDLEELMNFVITHGGMHFKVIEPGEAFEQPLTSAGEMPTLEEIKAYTALQSANFQSNIAFAYSSNDRYVRLAESVRQQFAIDAGLDEETIAAIEVYYGEEQNRVLSPFYFDVLMIEMLRDENYSFEADEAHHKDRVEALYDLYHRILFPHLYE